MSSTETISADWLNEYSRLADILSELKSQLNYTELYLSGNKYEPVRRHKETKEKERLEKEIAKVELEMKKLESNNETAADKYNRLCN